MTVKQIMETFSISGTFARNIHRNKVNTPDEYRAIRKSRKKREKSLSQAKRDRAKAGRRSKDSKKKK